VDDAPVRLSSDLTFVYKFVFPTVWLLGFSCATALLLTRPNERGLAIPFGIATIVGALLFWKACFPLKLVTAYREGIRVSNFFREVVIPYEQISDVHEYKWLNTRLTTIGLKRDTPFGQEIKFQPYIHFTLLLWRDHPAVVELRKRMQSLSEGPRSWTSPRPGQQ